MIITTNIIFTVSIFSFLQIAVVRIYENGLNIYGSNLTITAC